jgi:hypothetical protein
MAAMAFVDRVGPWGMSANALFRILLSLTRPSNLIQ